MGRLWPTPRKWSTTWNGRNGHYNVYILSPQSYILVYKQRTTPFIDFILNLQSVQMGDKKGQMGKYLKGANVKISN